MPILLCPISESELAVGVLAPRVQVASLTDHEGVVPAADHQLDLGLPTSYQFILNYNIIRLCYNITGAPGDRLAGGQARHGVPRAYSQNIYVFMCVCVYIYIYIYIYIYTHII